MPRRRTPGSCRPPTRSTTSTTSSSPRARRWQRRLFDGGWAGITWPVEFGGRGGDVVQAMIFRQEESRFDVTSGLFAVAIGMAGPTIIGHGTDDQRARYLPAMLRGRGGLVPAVQRTRSRLGPGQPGHPGRPRRRRVGRQRSEGVEFGRPPRRPGDPAGPDRSRPAQAPRHHLLHPRHAHPGHRGAPAPPDDRRSDLQRGVPHRRAESRRPTWSGR